MNERLSHTRAAGLIMALLGGCAAMSENETAGTVPGDQFGKGGGKTVAAVLGAIIGAAAGRNIGKT